MCAPHYHMHLLATLLADQVIVPSKLDLGMRLGFFFRVKVLKTKKFKHFHMLLSVPRANVCPMEVSTCYNSIHEQ